MSPSNNLVFADPRKVWFRRIAATVVAIASLVVLGKFVVETLQIDPFVRVRPRAIPGVDEFTAVQLEKVRLRRFAAGKLVTQAEVDKVAIQRDQNSAQMTNVRNGTHVGKNGKVRFAAKSATWIGVQRRLLVDGKARVKSNDFDIETESMSVDEQSKLVQIPKGLSGKLKDGVGKADRLTMNYDTEAFKVGKVAYAGGLPGVQDGEAKAAGQNAGTQWQVSAERGDDSGKETKVSRWYDASATDGEILVKAPNIVIDRKTDELTANGRVFYYSGKANLVADKIVVYRKEKRAVLTGNVLMLVKPKEEEANYSPKEEDIPPFRPLVPDSVKGGDGTFGPTPEERALDKKLREGDTVREFPTVVTADRIEYFYRKGERRATITGNPQARQEFAKTRWRQVWTHTALYDGEAETLRLTSRDGKMETRFKNSIGDDLVAKAVLLHTAEGDERYSTEKARGRVYSDPDDDETKKAEPKKTGGG